MLKCFTASTIVFHRYSVFKQNMDHQHFLTFPPGYGPFTLGIFDESFDFRTRLPPEDNRETENRREREMASRQRYSARQPRGRHVPRRQSARHEGVPTLEGWDYCCRSQKGFALFFKEYMLQMLMYHYSGLISYLVAVFLNKALSYVILYCNSFPAHRIIQQLVNGIIAPTAMPNIGMGSW